MLKHLTAPKFLLLAFSIAILLSPLYAQAKPLPTPMTGAIILKLMQLEAEGEATNDLKILVVNDPDLGKYLHTKIGTRIGKRQLTQVWNDKIPEDAKPNIIYINSNKQLNDVVAYAKEIQALTISSDISKAAQGVVLFIYDDEGLPGISINISASKAIGYKWNPKILEISKAIQ